MFFFCFVFVVYIFYDQVLMSVTREDNLDAYIWWLRMNC